MILFLSHTSSHDQQQVSDPYFVPASVQQSPHILSTSTTGSEGQYICFFVAARHILSYNQQPVSDPKHLPSGLIQFHDQQDVRDNAFF